MLACINEKENGGGDDEGEGGGEDEDDVSAILCRSMPWCYVMLR